MLSRPVPLHDVQDAEAFVRRCIRLSGIRPQGGDEYEELVAEGLAILCDLASKFVPRKEGYDRDGSFAGYAARYAPRKIAEAWRRMHREHVVVTDPLTKKRSVSYGFAPLSLDNAAPHNETRFRGPSEFVAVPTPAA